MSHHWLIKAAQSVPGSRQPSEDFDLQGDLPTLWRKAALATGVTEIQLADAVSELLGLPRSVFAKIERGYAAQLPENVARTLQMVPIVLDGVQALVACADPTDVDGLRQVSFVLGVSVDARVATPAEIESVLLDVHGSDGGELKNWGEVPTSLLAAELTLRRKDGSIVQHGESATSKLFVELLRRAYHVEASDIHIQPYGDGAVVRNRVDGVLYQTIDLPANVHNHLTRHVKAIANMDPTKNMLPQDGELHMELEHSQVDLRLSVLPVAGSERLVVRLLPQNRVRTLAMLGLGEQDQVKLKAIAGNADGMTLVTGPTGSGKSSLLYAMLAEKNTPDVNIMTVEEPVEYTMRGASQIDVNVGTGLTFAASLRSILRQDPDVVMIGEIRDEETAEIAAQAAMTGHFVLSTVHTLDALLATIRLADLGVSSATIADAVNAIAAQRLIRVLCQSCRIGLEQEHYTAEEKLFAEIHSNPQWRSAGCEKCRSTGFQGRVPVLEIVEFNSDMRDALRSGVVDVKELETIAAASGTQYLPEGFAAHIEQGITTVDEVIRVFGTNFFERLKYCQNLKRAVGSKS